MQEWDYRCDMEVRDYEIDMQGIVNHAIYVNYLEYCRAKYTRELGIDVYKLHEQGYDLVVANLQQSYKSSLRPAEEFYILARMRREGRLRVVFDQEIRRSKDDSLILTANVVVACIALKSGKPCAPDILFDKIK